MHPLISHSMYLLYRLGMRVPLVRAQLGRVPEAALHAYFVRDFVHGSYGAAYGLGPKDKAALVRQFERNVRAIPSGTSALVHTILAREILSVPPEVAGDVIECGVWKGASSASLSLVCRVVGRRLLVCDSFAGLPDGGLELYHLPHLGTYGYLKQGMFRGTLDEVQSNIQQYGAPNVCQFVPGFFAESLQHLLDPIAFAFLDVDLVRSNQDCLRAIWPLLIPNGALYTDDAGSLDVVRIFFDDDWWQQHLGCRAPGLIGSGCGLPLNPRFCPLGYTRKATAFDPAQWQRVSHLFYPDDQPHTGT